MLKLTIHCKDVSPSQRLKVAVGARPVTVTLDHRFNNCQLATLEDPEAATEDVELIMLRVGETLERPEAKHVGSFKDNAGMVHVFWAGVPKPAPEKVPLTKDIIDQALRVGALT